MRLAPVGDQSMDLNVKRRLHTMKTIAWYNLVVVSLGLQSLESSGGQTSAAIA